MTNCGCPLAELYAKAAKERDEARRELGELREKYDYLTKEYEARQNELFRLRAEYTTVEG